MVAMSATTDAIVEQLKTLTARPRPRPGTAAFRRRAGPGLRTLCPALRRAGLCSLGAPRVRRRNPCGDVAAIPLTGRPAAARVGAATPTAGSAMLKRCVPLPQLLEAAELVKQIEATFGVDASAPTGGGMMMIAGPAGAAAPAEEAEVQTEFKLIIVDCDAAKRIGAIKVVRSLTSLGLKEAKDAVTTLPFTILDAKPKADVRVPPALAQPAPVCSTVGGAGCVVVVVLFRAAPCPFVRSDDGLWPRSRLRRRRRSWRRLAASARSSRLTAVLRGGGCCIIR